MRALPCEPPRATTVARILGLTPSASSTEPMLMSEALREIERSLKFVM